MEFRSGFIAIVGRANVGKSTLLNALVGQKLSIVSAKPHTTRHALLGILQNENFQAALLDTPGYLTLGRDHLDKAMSHQLKNALADSDIAILVVEPRPPGDIEKELIEQLKKGGTLSILCINKIDTVSKSRLLPVIERYSAIHNFSAIVPVSAVTEDGLAILIKQTIENLKPQEPIFPSGHLTNKPPEFLISEIIREKVFEQYDDEIPYDVAVEIESFEYRGSNKPDLLQAIIHVAANSQKKVLIGRSGVAIKQVGIAARPEIEALAGRKVYLELWVKVTQNWKKKTGFVQRIM